MTKSHTLNHEEIRSPEPGILDLKKLVKRYRMCWEVFSECVYVDHKRMQTGFRLELIGTHEASVRNPEPGCVKCQDVFGALRAVAGWILPKEERLSMYEIAIFDNSIKYDTLRRNRPDITLAIRIMHRAGFAPVDPCEERCLKEMQQKLLELGAAPQHWKDRGKNLEAV